MDEMHTCRMDALTLQLITWLADRPRTYGEVMEAWTTTCPKMPVWEDAVTNGLVRVEGAGSIRQRAVILTPRSRALLNSQTNTGAAPTHGAPSISSATVSTAKPPSGRPSRSGVRAEAMASSG
jgi:hypothetical protein